MKWKSLVRIFYYLLCVYVKNKKKTKPKNKTKQMLQPFVKSTATYYTSLLLTDIYPYSSTMVKKKKNLKKSKSKSRDDIVT